MFGQSELDPCCHREIVWCHPLDRCCHYLNSFQVCNIKFARSIVFDSSLSASAFLILLAAWKYICYFADEFWLWVCSVPSPSGICLFIIIFNFILFIYFSSRLWPVCFFFLFFFCNSVLNSSSSTVCQCEEAVHCDRQPLWDNSSSVSKQSTENDGSSSILQTIRTAWDNQARPWRCPVEEQGWWSQPRVTDLRRRVSEMENWKSWLAAEFGDILHGNTSFFFPESIFVFNSNV